MAWRNRTVKCRYVDYWLTLKRIDFVTNETTTEYYIHHSYDMDPDMFVDKDNNNELDGDFWVLSGQEEFDKACPETMRSVEYVPTSEWEDQVRTLWIFQYAYRTERAVIKERGKASCASCEYYIRVSGVPEESPVKCDFRTGESYYCKGYADLETCRKCRLHDSVSKGRCMFHSRYDGVKGTTICGNCDEWNLSGECEGFEERFED